MFAGDPLEGLPDKSWDDNSSQQIQGEVSNATESTTVEGVLRNSDGETVSDEDSADRGPFDLSYERDDIRSEMGYDDHDLTLNLSIYDGEEHVDSVEGEFSWDVRIPPTLTMTNDTVSVTNDSSTVSLDVENTGNTSGTWEVGLEVDGNETDNATIEALSEGEVHTVELTADSKLNPDNNVTVTCTAQQEDSVCESDRKQITVSEDG